MAAFGYGNVPDRAFVAFDRELEVGIWKEVSAKKEAPAKESAAELLNAPQPVVW